MGTALTAHVEVKLLGEHAWWRVASWDLGKNYELMRALNDQAEKDWPKDVRDRDYPQNDFHRYWMDGDTAVSDIEGETSSIWKALNASILPLCRAGQVRILYLEI